MRRIGSWKSWSKRRKLTTGVCVIAVVAGAIGLSGGSDTEVIYKETTVKYGTLVKGVTESGSVDIGTVDQTFDLDMSALQRTDTSGSSSSGGSSGSTAGSSSGSGGFGGMSASGGGAQGGLDMFGQIFNMGGSTYLEVITAQQSLLNAELSKVQDDFYKMQAVVNLYYALGGGRE